MIHFRKLALGCALAVAALASSAMAAEVTIKVAYENNPGEPVDVLMNKWAELVAERSDGKVALETYPSSQMGSKNDIIDQAMMGVNVITIADAGFLTDFDPDWGILYGPYLAESPEQLFRLYEGDWFAKKKEELQAKGIRIVIANYMYGRRHLLSKKKVESPDDMKGMKVRTPNNPMQIKAISMMGGTPTPMPLGDVYPALTQGIIDGVENPLTVLHGQKLDEQAKELSMIDYLTTSALWLGGEAYFASLDPEVVALLEETGHEIGVASQQAAETDEADMLAAMEEMGVKVTRPDLEPFREITRDFYNQFPEWSDGLYETIQAELKK